MTNKINELVIPSSSGKSEHVILNNAFKGAGTALNTVAADNAPPVPVPTTPSDVLPKKSGYLTISTSPYYKDGDIKDGKVPVNVLYKGKGMPAYNKIDGQSNYVLPEFPTQQLQNQRYWLNTFSITVSGPQTFTREIETIQGMSTTDMSTFSAELGVAVSDLSVKVSASTSHTVTITESNTVTDTYNFTVPKGKIGVWTLWQLVDVFIFVDENEVPITWIGNIYMGGFPIGENYACINTFQTNLETYNANLVLFDA